MPKSDPKKVTVIGAGMMGAGIAYVQALAGIETILIDQTQEAADKGKAHVEELLKKRLSRGQLTQEKYDALLGSVTATTDYELIKGSDLVVEAVFENREIKADVTKRAEAQLADGAVFGSNTSTLPITGLAEASVRPEDFIGIHFFSPVDKMMLVEIILGEKTGQAAIAKALDYVLKIKKTPIVVNDSRGFYTSRCFSTFLMEGMAMLEEGYGPALIDNVGRMTGMPRGPLEMHDDVALDLSYKIAKQTALDLGDKYVPSEGADIVARMVEGGRFGRKNGKGFYDYDQKPKTIWKGLGELAPDHQGHRSAGRADRLRPDRRTEDAPAVSPGRRSGPLLGRRRHRRSARSRSGRHPGLGLRALDRRSDQHDRRHRPGQVRRNRRSSGRDLRRPLQGPAVAARHGREERDLLRQVRPGEGRRLIDCGHGWTTERAASGSPVLV